MSCSVMGNVIPMQAAPSYNLSRGKIDVCSKPEEHIKQNGISILTVNSGVCNMN